LTRLLQARTVHESIHYAFSLNVRREPGGHQ
jgi:hypothetical protein